MGYIEDRLDPGERIVFRSGQHVAMFLWPMVVLALASLAYVVGFGILGAICSFAFGWLMVRTLAGYLTTTVAVTDQRLIARAGVINRHSLDVALDDVDEVVIGLSPIGATFGYADIVITSFDGPRQTFSAVADAEAFERHFREQLDEAE